MGSRPKTRVEALLTELCTRYGYCLAPEDEAALVADPPQDVDRFLDAVLLAEGLDPDLFDKGRRRELSEVVRRWLFGETDEGRESGLSQGGP